jgi:predicted RNase H-like nuclease (RuvC/YqgF family)
MNLEMTRKNVLLAMKLRNITQLDGETLNETIKRSGGWEFTSEEMIEFYKLKFEDMEKSYLKVFDDANDLRHEVMELRHKNGNLNSSINSLEKKVEEFENKLNSGETPLPPSVQEELDFLNALRATGVDNWVGYDLAHDYMRDGEY